MKARRLALRSGAGLVCLSAVSLGTPAVETGLDSSGGTTVGGWTCGPAARVNYAGLHGRVQVAERSRDAPDGPGFGAELGVSLESQNHELIACGGDCTPEKKELPPDRVMWAGGLRGGYRSADFGLLLGTTLFQGFRRHADREPELGWCPEFEFSMGPRKSWFFAAGLGSGSSTTLHRPGVYFGGGVGDAGYRLELFMGVHRQGPSLDDWWSPNADTGRRVNVIGWVPLSSRVDLRLGASRDLEEGRSGGEGSVGSRFYF